MSYTPTNWKSGDVITSEKLNKLEGGVQGASGVFVIHSTLDLESGIETLNKTWKEINDAIAEDKFPVVINSNESGSFIKYVSGTGIAPDYYVDVYYFTSTPEGGSVVRVTFETESENGYPSYRETPK